MTNYYLVAVDTPFNNSLLTYKSCDNFEVGDFVLVPLRNRKAKGCILELLIEEIENKEKIKNIIEKNEDDLRLRESELKLYQWISNYYHYSLGQLIFETIPKSMKKKKDIFLSPSAEKPTEYTPTPLQQKVIDNLLDKIRENKFFSSLIHGVTGSGKSIIYLNLMREVLNKGKSVLFLLPEINLTPQFVSFFLSQFKNCKVNVYHSELTDSERYNLWYSLSKSSQEEARLIIGVRSSIFLPVSNLGLIVVDEEHDGSLKQDDRCPYNARDLALKRGSLQGFPVILGSATPSLESYNLLKGTDNYFQLFERVNEAALPTIELIDLKRKDEDKRGWNDYWPLTEESINKIRSAIEQDEQVLIFVSRLGYASYLLCSDCGHRFSCPNCSNNLRYYESKKEMKCHICGYTDKLPYYCPICHNLKIIQKGYGTERIQEILSKEFPTNVVKRFDRDEITTFKKLKDRLNEFHSGQVDILVGTQMLSKGHNFEKVNLVVVLGVDSQLNFPDFRAVEKTYQLLVQVAGRGGRFGKKGRVLIHTYNPENPLYNHLRPEVNPEDFYKEELEVRSMIGSPPYSRFTMLYFTGKSREKVYEYSEWAAQKARQMSDDHFASVEVMGPRPSFIEKRVNKYTWCVMLKSQDRNQLHQMAYNLKNYLSQSKDVTLKIDQDPYTIM